VEHREVRRDGGRPAVRRGPRTRGDRAARRRRGRFHIVTLGQMTCDASSFFVENEIRVSEGDEDAEREVFGKTWRRRAPRDFV